MPAGPSASTSTALLRIVLHAARRRGLSERAFARHVGVPMASLDRLGRVPIALARRVWEASAHLTGAEDLGIQAVESAAPGAFGSLERMIRTSATWGDGMQRLVRFVTMHNGASTMRVELRGRRVHIFHDAPNAARPGTDVLLAVIGLNTREYLGAHVAPLYVASVHGRPESIRSYERVFQASLRFDAPTTEIVFDREIFDCPMRFADPRVADLLERFALGDRAGGAPPSRHDDRSDGGWDLEAAPRLLVDARLAIRFCLEQGHVRSDRVAALLGTSRRSLQRYLRAEGASLRGLVEQCREEVARQVLGAETGTRAAVALGYADPRSLRRARQRWRDRARDEPRAR